ncbi:MAG: DegT/DnrJ/EryC1/StrS family aminotransferase [Actinomycetota bacterium]|nr:DegT/DnrJ/EryC1/StrS family aminotransferase [Actinomycetota bacterium]
MKIPFIDLSRQYRAYKEDFDKITSEVFEKGSFVFGENCSAFEHEFAEYIGTSHGVGVGSGTEAIHIALLACGIKSGDEVITVSNTAVPTVSAIDFAGATPVFADIDDSFDINPQLIEEKITDKTKVIMPVHLFGNPCKMDMICSIAEKHNLMVVEDCAQAHGAELNGRKAGTFGQVSCFSFYPSKNLGANGDGGMILTSDAEIARKAKLLRYYGFEDRYKSVMRGFNSRLDEIQAALLRFKLKKLESWIERRNQIAQIYAEGLKGLPLKIPAVLPGGRHVYHLFVTQLENQEKRDRLMRYLSEKEITTLIHYPIPIHLQPAYDYLGCREGSLPVTENAAKTIVSLPLFPEMKNSETDYVIENIISFFNYS